jgi:hypothetical protein
MCKVATYIVYDLSEEARVRLLERGECAPKTICKIFEGPVPDVVARLGRKSRDGQKIIVFAGSTDHYKLPDGSSLGISDHLQIPKVVKRTLMRRTDDLGLVFYDGFDIKYEDIVLVSDENLSLDQVSDFLLECERGSERLTEDHMRFNESAFAQAYERLRREKEEQERKLRQEAEEQERKRKERERGIENLRAWAIENGSELLRARIEEGFEWIDLAKKEYALQFLSDFEIVSLPREGEIKERNKPSIEEINALRSVRNALGDKGRARLVRLVTYDESVTLVEVEVETPVGKKVLYVKI